MSPGDVLSTRALNRATLHRQRLLDRSGGVTDTIEHLVGMQAQNPLDPYFGLWSRVDGFESGALADLVTGRKVVRAQLMRGTIHMVTADDYRSIHPVMARVLERVFRSTAFARDVAPVDESVLLAEARRHLSNKPIGRAELGRMLGSSLPGIAPGSLGQTATFMLPVVQTPPRGVWGRKGAAKWMLAEEWLGTPIGEGITVEELVRRYLGAFGPASVADMRAWSGVAGLREVVDGMRAHLRVFRGEDGQELLDLPDMTYPDPDTPALPRFLPEYDNVLLGHADRSRFFDGPFSPGWVGSILVDGIYSGWWRLDDDRTGTAIEIVIQRKLSRHQKAETGEEAGRLLGWLGSDPGLVRYRDADRTGA